MNIIDFIKVMDSNNSQNYKLEKLKEGLKDAEILDWIRIVYDTNNNFYLSDKSLPHKDSTEFSNYTELSIKSMLLKMANREVSRNEVLEYYGNLSSEFSELFKKCLRKSLFINISTKLINKAYKDLNDSDLFNTPPYMRCSTIDDLENIDYPAICQLKADGVYVNILVDINEKNKIEKIDIISRSGSKMDLNQNGFLLTRIKNSLENSDMKLVSNSFVLMGELLVLDDEDKILPRSKGNGLINSLSKQFSTISTLEEKASKSYSNNKKLKERKAVFEYIENRVIVKVWDILDKKEWIKEIPYSTKYEDRFNTILKMFGSNKDNDIITPIEYKKVNSDKEVYEYYLECIKRGEEGAILKNLNAVYKDGTSKEQIKMKEIKDCDLLCIGFEYGSGQFKNGIGSLICISSDNKIKVNVSGLSRGMRGLELIDENDISKGLKVIENFDFNKYTNKIITIQFNSVIKNDIDNTFSLFLPRILEIREDKSEADDFDYISKL